MEEKAKYPLLMIQPSRALARVVWRCCREGYNEIKCPFQRDPCTIECAALVLVDDEINAKLICRATPRPFILGVVDSEILTPELMDELSRGTLTE
jgi:hypothetical protein